MISIMLRTIVQMNVDRPPASLGLLMLQLPSVRPLNHAGKVRSVSLHAANAVCGAATPSVAPPAVATKKSAAIQFRIFLTIFFRFLCKYSTRHQEVQQE